jgi:hypothetical protein
MLANSLDASGSSGRPIAADQKRPTTRASWQSNVTQAILIVIEPPAAAQDEQAQPIFRAGKSSRTEGGPAACRGGDAAMMAR